MNPEEQGREDSARDNSGLQDSGGEDSGSENSKRRAFLVKVNLGLGAFGALMLGAPVIGFLFAPLFRQIDRKWQSVGEVSKFAQGQTVEVEFDDASPLPWAGLSSKTAAWLQRKNETEFVAFSVTCSHLGCPVRWMADARLFLCPCHGGVYYSDGSVAGGPPPRGLTQYPVRINQGQVEILTSPTPIT